MADATPTSKEQVTIPTLEEGEKARAEYHKIHGPGGPDGPGWNWIAGYSACLRDARLSLETPVSPEFAAQFERGLVLAAIKEVEDFVGDRTDPHSAGISLACEEIKCRLEEAWAKLPAENGESAHGK